MDDELRKRAELLYPDGCTIIWRSAGLAHQMPVPGVGPWTGEHPPTLRMVQLSELDEKWQALYGTKTVREVLTGSNS